jgi:hypothetical protein
LPSMSPVVRCPKTAVAKQSMTDIVIKAYLNLLRIGGLL